LWGDADDPVVVAGGGDDPGDVRPVPVAVVEVLPRLARGQIDAVDVVDIAVVVVVDPVARGLAEVRPDVGGEVGVAQSRAGVDDRDGDALAFGELPGAGQVQQGAGRDRPLLSLAGIVGARGARRPRPGGRRANSA